MNLSDDQKAQMKTINENFHNQMKSLNENKSLSQEALKEKKESLMNERKTQMSALLTPEQKKQWEEKRKEHSFKGKDGEKFDKRNKDRKQNS
jgi:Spy/CpxP family protein refolding chaperone